MKPDNLARDLEALAAICRSASARTDAAWWARARADERARARSDRLRVAAAILRQGGWDGQGGTTDG